MSSTIDPRTLPVFDVARYLHSPEDIAAYLTVVAKENDPATLAQALGDVARARGMTAIAEASGLQRESLYKALGAGASQPQFDTIRRVCAALGVRVGFTAMPASKAGKTKDRNDTTKRKVLAMTPSARSKAAGHGLAGPDRPRKTAAPA